MLKACEAEGLIDAIGFWKWNFNDDFLCNIHTTKVVGGYFKSQEDFLRDIWHARKSLGKILGIQRSKGLSFCSEGYIKIWGLANKMGKGYNMKQNDE